MISDITVSCNVKVLWIGGNHTIGEDEQLYSILTNPSTMLEILIMNYTALSSRAAIALFTALKDNNKLKELYIGHNNITDDASDTIIAALQRNSCLVGLYMENNPMTGEAIVNILNGVRDNNTLAMLYLPKYPEDISKKISLLEVVISMKRQSRGSQVKLEIDY